MSKDEPVILSLGGSLIVPNGGINTEFLKRFNEFIRKQITAGKRFFIVCGGGRTSRHYADAADTVLGKQIPPVELDWLSIHATRLNAHLLRTIFKDIANSRLVTHYDREYKLGPQPVVIGAGWKPGWSTDYDAVLLAQRYKSKVLINLSNIETVYDKDPHKHSNARPIKKINWNEYRQIVGNKWSPNLSAPFDPIASRLAQEIGLTVIIVKGDNFSNLEKVFNGGKFHGTVISP
ncbi:MAG: UMP kinase [Candidatus Gottesmanbacteria bacterium]